MLLLFSSCSEKIVYPPVRFVQDGYHYFHGAYTFDSNIEESVAIAHIRIGNWLYEVGDSGMGYTVFEGHVLCSYKGKLPKKIPIAFDGNSKISLDKGPLPTYGNEFFIFLNYYKPDDGKEYYYSMQSRFAYFDIITGKDETKYLIGYNSSSIVGELSNKLKNYNNMGPELVEIKKEQDPSKKDAFLCFCNRKIFANKK